MFTIFTQTNYANNNHSDVALALTKIFLQYDIHCVHSVLLQHIVQRRIARNASSLGLIAICRKCVHPLVPPAALYCLFDSERHNNKNNERNRILRPAAEARRGPKAVSDVGPTAASDRQLCQPAVLGQQRLLLKQRGAPAKSFLGGHMQHSFALPALALAGKVPVWGVLAERIDLRSNLRHLLRSISRRTSSDFWASPAGTVPSSLSPTLRPEDSSFLPRCQGKSPPICLPHDELLTLNPRLSTSGRSSPFCRAVVPVPALSFSRQGVWQTLLTTQQQYPEKNQRKAPPCFRPYRQSTNCRGRSSART